MSFSKITKNLSIFILSSLIFTGFFNIALAQQNTYGLNESAQGVDAFTEQVANPDDNFLNTKIGSVIGIILSFIGVIFLILMIIAGLTWMTAFGNQEKVNKAKDLIINSIIGLVIVMAAYAITAFIGDRLI